MFGAFCFEPPGTWIVEMWQCDKQYYMQPFRVAFFNTFIAYRCPESLPFIFLTRNTFTHAYTSVFWLYKTITVLMKQGVALTGCNCTGPPFIEGCRTTHAPGRLCADRLCARRPACQQRYRRRQMTPPDNRHQQMTACKWYWPIRRASKKTQSLLEKWKK